ncbi:RNA polymerase sigma-70 factor [Bacillus oleivorans]|uniref:RNA polymerase sigma factor n=1 Tax=Bacillus oleivorans TaxID=1448271 RepID=A0A285CM03_9BACI|nr:RNA polymerase sigma factor [Bacillus oleivorans]SNX68577.1 RNA polymerase sigma-70 factor [Bacillus oleivorans]
MSAKRTISEWFFQYSHDIYDFLVYYMGSTDVEDLVQEVYIKALRSLHGFKGESSPKTWLIKIARNVAIDEYRKKKSKGFHHMISFTERIAANDPLTPEKIFENNETKQDLYKAIQRLHETYRDVLILRGIQEMDTKETAVILNWKEEKVRTTYHRALKALRESQGGIEL